MAKPAAAQGGPGRHKKRELEQRQLARRQDRGGASRERTSSPGDEAASTRGAKEEAAAPGAEAENARLDGPGQGGEAAGTGRALDGQGEDADGTRTGENGRIRHRTPPDPQTTDRPTGARGQPHPDGQPNATQTRRRGQQTGRKTRRRGRRPTRTQRGRRPTRNRNRTQTQTQREPGPQQEGSRSRPRGAQQGTRGGDHTQGNGERKRNRGRTRRGGPSKSHRTSKRHQRRTQPHQTTHTQKQTFYYPFFTIIIPLLYHIFHLFVKYQFYLYIIDINLPPFQSVRLSSSSSLLSAEFVERSSVGEFSPGVVERRTTGSSVRDCI